MKKVFLLLTLVAMTFSAWADGFKTVSKTPATIASEHSLQHNRDSSNIPFDENITFNHFKYITDAGGQFRLYFQNNWSGSKFTLTAKSGVIIHTVKFTYTANSNTILSDAFYWGGDGKTVPSEHQIISGTTYVVDATSKTFWVGITSGTSGSAVNITAFEISYTYPASPELKFAKDVVDVCKNAASFFNPLQNKGNGAVTYSGGSSSVATVAADGTITVKGVGSTTITATTTATSLYKSESKSYAINVSSDLTPSPLAPVEYTESKDVASMATQYGWKKDTSYISFKLNNAITITAPSGQAKYLNENTPSMRYYRYGEGKVNINAKEGVIIKSAQLDYGRVDSGLVTWNWGTNGQNIPSSFVLYSGKSRAVNANSVSFSIGQNNLPSKNGQVRITNYKVVYTDPTIVLEQFKAYISGTSTQRIIGDNGIYKWRVTAQNHTDTVCKYKAVKLEYADSIASDGVMEGGIKSISFDWHTAGGNYPIHFFVKAGDTNNEISNDTRNITNRFWTYSYDFGIESNTTLSIYNPAKEATPQNHIDVGPIHITPYLLFNVANHADTFNIEQGTTCDLNSALINNTGENTHTFSIFENTAGGKPQITNGILDFSSVVRTGYITVQAKWKGVTTNLTLKINLQSPGISFPKEKDTVIISQDPYKQELNKGLSTGTVTYSLVSAPQGASISPSTGEVTLSAAGEYKVKGKIAAALPYAEDSATYTLLVTSLPIPVITFEEETVNKAMPFTPFFNNINTGGSDGKKHFTSSDPRVATVNDSTGWVAMGEKPGTTTISVTIDPTSAYSAGNAEYTLNVSAAPIADLHKVSTTVEQIKGTTVWPTGSDNERARYNEKIDDVITVSYGKYYYENEVHKFRYYYQDNTQASKFTIQAKAGVIIQSVKLIYDAGANSVFTDVYCYGQNAPEGHKVESGVPFKVDANAVTFYNSVRDKASAGAGINVTGYEIIYFKPATGVAVTKSAADLGKDLALVGDQCYQNIAINHAIKLHADDANTMRYKGSGFDCYRHKGAIDIIARPGATIHYVKITYSSANGTDNFVLTKYFGTDGFNIPAIDQIASDSILYVNANSLKLYVGTPQADAGWSGVRISKIYVNYTDYSEVVVDNFNNCTILGKEGSEPVAGVDGKYNWTITNFSRGNADRMYYDQSIKLNKGGKISTQYTGGLRGLAFDWHPTESGKAVNFTVIAGDSSWTVSKTAAEMDKIYTFNFPKLNNKTNGEFAIIADSAIEFGHISLTPYLYYAQKSETIYAKDYKESGWKYTSPNVLTNYTGQTVQYSVSGENAENIASINPSTGEITILSGGTVSINATADGATASYQLTINLEATAVKFETKEFTKLLSTVDFQQKLVEETVPDTGKVINYSFVSAPEGATINSSTGLVTFNGATGTYIVKGRLEQNLPFAAAEDTYTLTVNKAPSPEIYFPIDSLSKDLHDTAFINPLTAPAEVGKATYTSSDVNVATVDENSGLVTIVGTGKTTIRVTVAECQKFIADTASYLLYVLPLPTMTFAHNDTTVYLSTINFTNELFVTPGAGTVTYTSDNPTVASVNYTSGLVSRGEKGDAVITATTAKNDQFSAGSASYNVHVISQYVTTAAFASPSVTKKQNDAPFKNTLNINPTSDGKVTYSSSNEQVATVNSTGYVTMQGRLGVAIITANVAATATYLATSATFTLTVQGAPAEDEKVANGNVAQIAQKLNWPTPGDDTTACKKWIKLDDVISTYTPVTGNAKYFYNSSTGEKSLRYYQGSNKGQFIIRAKAGAIIQSIKLTYVQVGTGVVATNYGANNDGKNIAVTDRLVSGVAKKFDANSVTLYVGSTGNDAGQQVRITNFEVKYFDPSEGVAVTKSAADLGKDLGLISNLKDGYYDIPVNNVISLHATQKGTLKYYSDQNSTSINCYLWTGPIDIKAREGATIHYVKITYTGGPRATLTKYYGTDGKLIPKADRIASDSILYVNANSLRLYVGDTLRNETTSPTIGITKIYVNYTDRDETVVETFEKCSVANSIKSTNVDGIDNTYKWKLTNYNMDSTHHIYYDQSIMLRTDKESKIETMSEEGGFKEISFDWFVNTPSKQSKFTVKAGDMTDVVDSAAMGSNYKITYTKTGIKSNGAFSITTATGSDTYTYMEVGHISLTPYLLYTTKAENLNLTTTTKTFQKAPEIDNRDDDEAISYSFVEDDVTFATIDPKTGIVTASDSGKVTVKATWHNVYTTYKLTIGPNAVAIEDEDYPTSSIPADANVTIKEGGSVITDDGNDCQWGNLCVKAGGKMTIDPSVEVTVKNFIIESTMAGGKSGQIKGAADNINITGDAYYDLTLGDNANADHWHAFAVPFQVDMINGIYNASNGAKLTNEKDYAIMVYQGDVRAQGKYGWIKVPKTGTTILQPGTFYLMTVNGDVKTFRMKMYGDFSVADKNVPVYEYASTTGNNDNGWNGISNNQLAYVSLDKNVQVLDPSSYTFVAKPANDFDFTVGTPFFYQSAVDGSVELLAAQGGTPYAPRRMAYTELKNVDITLADSKFTDHLFISSTDEATDAYQIGRDLTKMSMTSTPAVPQIFAKAYNDFKLCMIDLPMENDEVSYALSLYAPKAGEYTLAAAQVEGYQIFLTNQGEIIWNLSQDAYSVDLEKGNTDTYGLVLKKMPNTPTGMQNAQSTMQGVQKFIFNDQLIIIRDGKQFNAQGAAQ